MLDLKAQYSRSLRVGELHFAAHSHHPRPDFTRDATIACWDDAARMLDRKWEPIFGSIIPKAQQFVAEILDVSPNHIAFGQNTHEFVTRIISAFDPQKSLRILTTGSEFRSFTRQLARLRERGNVEVTVIDTNPSEDFVSRFARAASSPYQLVYFSQVFFDSGYRLRQSEMEAIVAATHPESTIVIDGYHGFFAVPTSLHSLQKRVFYVAGGYKYAQWGEGACFLVVPHNCKLRPENTGWFAEFGDLQKDSSRNLTQYPEGAFRFWGATFDPAGLYRLISVCEWMKQEGFGVAQIRNHVLQLQHRFLEQIDRLRDSPIRMDTLVSPVMYDMRGNFLAFDLRGQTAASTAERTLRKYGVIVDSRGAVLRIGFGIYHSLGDVDVLVDRLRLIFDAIGKEYA